MSASLLVLSILLHGAPPGLRQEPSACAAASALLLRVESPQAAARAALVRELLALEGVTGCLLEALGSGRTPATEGDEEGGGARLDEGQRALVLEALLAARRERLAAFVAEVGVRPETPERLAAAVRLAGAGAFDPAQLGRLVRPGLAEHELVTEAFEAALGDLLRRAPHAYPLVESWWRTLPEGLACAALRALAGLGEPAGFECLVRWLGVRPEFDEGVILALGGLAHLARLEEARQLALDLVEYRAPTAAAERAVLTTLGRLKVPETIPFLIEPLVAEDAPTLRTAHAALRAVSGADLPASVPAWRAWYAREETWWQEVAPERIERLAGAAAAGLAVADVHALARELCEHPLHREDLARAFRPALAHPDPAVRVIACQALERLAARSGAPLLFPLLRSGSPEVLSAARAALVAITGIEWRGTAEAMARRLAARGFLPDE